MKVIKHILILLICLSGINAAWGQDPVFSQFYATPLQLNPAFAGITYAPRITFNHRNQWAGLNNAYVTYAASYEQSLENLNSGIGFIVMTDNAGDGIYRTNQFNAVYGYKVAIRRDLFVKFGVQAGILQNSVAWEKLTFGDQIDPVTGPTEGPSGEVIPESLNRSNLDLSAGVLFYSDKFYGGVAVNHLNSPDQSLLNVNENLSVGLPLRLVVHGGAEFELERGNNRKRPSFISPNISYNRQAGFEQINAGAYAGFDRFFAGLWYRHAGSNQDAVIGLVGFREGIFRIGYSYDFTISGLAASNTGGTHEISLTLNLENSRSVRRSRNANRYNDCFKMFK